MTGFYNFRPDEAGYEELRRLFDYLRAEGQIGPKFANKAAPESNGTNGISSGVEICVVDADDLLDNPSGMIEAFCKSTGIEWEPEMLVWNTEEDQKIAKEAFEKWKGFHEDALDSTELRARTHVSCQTSLYPPSWNLDGMEQEGIGDGYMVKWI
jgi:DNA repair and recombination protein RAD54B